MSEAGVGGMGLLGLLAAPFCCGGLVWLASAGFLAGAAFAWAGWAILAITVVGLTTGLVLWRRRFGRSHGD